MRRGTAPAIVAALALVAACGGSGDEASTSDTGSPEVTGAVASTTEPDAPDSPTTSTTEVAAPSGQAWTTATVVDPSRPTEQIVDGDGAVVLAAADERTIPVNLLYEGEDGGGPDATAAAIGPRPLAIILHGLGGTEEPGNPLPQRLHAEGFVVVMPNQQETSAPVVSVEGYPLLPADTSAILDALLDPDDGVADDLAPQIDGERIAVIGHSMGAAGAMAMAFHDCCRDERVDAIITFGASGFDYFGDRDFDFTGAPLLLVHGTEDQAAQQEAAEEILDRAGPDARLLLLEGADHFQPVYGNERPEAAKTAQDAIVAFLGVHLDGRSAVALDDLDLRTGNR